MLRFVTSNGSIEATAEDEKRVRGMTNAALFHALNTTGTPDLFAFAELKERNDIHYVEGHGWIVVQ